MPKIFSSIGLFKISHFARLAVVNIAILLLDPFGLSEATGQLSQGIVNRVLSPFYPRSGQDHVTGVVITDTFAQDHGGYPLAFTHHARALRSILCLDPAAVFIDLDFRHARNDPEGVNALAEALTYRVGPEGCGPVAREDLARPGVAPVFLAYLEKQDAVCSSILNANDEECQHMKPLGLLTAVTQPINVTDLVKHEQTYALLPRKDDGSFASSPALELTAALCRRKVISSQICDADRSEFNTDLFIRWGYYLSPLSVASRKVSGCDATPSTQVTWQEALQRSMTLLGSAFATSVHGLHTSDDSANRPAQSCVYSDYAGAGALFQPNVNSNQALKTLIADRAIVYGANITALPDVFASPVHGSVAGLFVHTMAVDNLLAQGAGYWREMPPLFSWASINLTHIMEILFIVAGLWLVGTGKTLPARLALALCCACVGLLSGLAGAAWLNLAPPDWVFAAGVQLLGAISDGPGDGTSST